MVAVLSTGKMIFWIVFHNILGSRKGKQVGGGGAGGVIRFPAVLAAGRESLTYGPPSSM